MPKPITRDGDLTTGHPCFPPRMPVLFSNDVFVNGKGVVREGDLYDVHCCGTSCHIGNLDKASTQVFANGKGIGRQGDPTSCSPIEVADKASSDVFAS